jgi:hypothetical protein
MRGPVAAALALLVLCAGDVDGDTVAIGIDLGTTMSVVANYRAIGNGGHGLQGEILTNEQGAFLIGRVGERSPFLEL